MIRKFSSLLSLQHLKKTFFLMLHYIKNPIQEIQKIPDWSWPELIVHQVILTAATGALSGLVISSFTEFLQGLILIPIISAVLLGVGSLFFYFFFQVLTGRTLSFRKIVTIVFFANIPFFVFQILSGWFPPIYLVGLAFTGLILITGFVHHFDLERRLVARVVILVYISFMMVWLWGRLDAMKFDRELSRKLDAPAVELGN